MKWLLRSTLVSLLLITAPIVFADTEEKAKNTNNTVKIVSLRGDHDNAKISEAFPEHKIVIEKGGIEVSFDDQPPMIPHESDDKEKISLTENNCLNCHSKATYKKKEAPKPTSTHFKGRDGEKTDELAANRYFCTQCHVPQVDTKVLIGNSFQAE